MAHGTRLLRDFCGVFRHIATPEDCAAILRYLGFMVAVWGKRDYFCSQPPLSLDDSLAATSEMIAELLEDADGTLSFYKIEEVMPHMTAEARHIYLGLSAEEFLAWVDATMKANGLSKMVFIWDKFSAFVDRNSSELKTLEQLAEAVQQGRFYFVPVTHTDISSYVASGSECAER